MLLPSLWATSSDPSRLGLEARWPGPGPSRPRTRRWPPHLGPSRLGSIKAEPRRLCPSTWLQSLGSSRPGLGLPSPPLRRSWSVDVRLAQEPMIEAWPRWTRAWAPRSWPQPRCTYVRSPERTTKRRRLRWPPKKTKFKLLPWSRWVHTDSGAHCMLCA